jgi:hypothetical protein
MGRLLILFNLIFVSIFLQASDLKNIRNIRGVIDGRINHYLSTDGKTENYNFYVFLPDTQEKIFVTFHTKSLGQNIGEFNSKAGDVVSLLGSYREKSSNGKLMKFLTINPPGGTRTIRKRLDHAVTYPPKTLPKKSDNTQAVALEKRQAIASKKQPPQKEIFTPMTEKEASKAADAYNKSVAKSRQAEAKVILSSIYFAEVSFKAEFDSYTTDLVSTGFSSESFKSPFYFCGFAMPMNDKIEYVPSLDQTRIDSSFVTKNLPLNYEKLRKAIPTSTTANKDRFSVACVGNIDYDETLDIWVVDETKTITNIVDDSEN